MNKCMECASPTKNPKFCGLSCSTKSQARSRPKKDKTRHCLNCNQSFDYGLDCAKVYCSRSCAAIKNNTGRVRNPNKKTDCECGGILKAGKTWCSVKCQHQFTNSRKIAGWLDGTWDATTGTGVSATIKRYLLEQADGKCPECEWDKINPSTGRCPLEVDHIDGNCYNNTVQNLRVVCPNCHSLSINYRALNKGGGRAYRRK